MRLTVVDDDLIEFAFTSVAAADLPESVLQRLADQSSAFNRRMGLTGELVVDGEGFAQVVEGPCTIVAALAARVLADPRHCRIRIVAFGRLAGGPRFAGWSVTGVELRLPRLVHVAPFRPVARIEETAADRRRPVSACIP